MKERCRDETRGTNTGHDTAPPPRNQPWVALIGRGIQDVQGSCAVPVGGPRCRKLQRAAVTHTRSQSVPRTSPVENLSTWDLDGDNALYTYQLEHYGSLSFSLGRSTMQSLQCELSDRLRLHVAVVVTQSFCRLPPSKVNNSGMESPSRANRATLLRTSQKKDKMRRPDAGAAQIRDRQCGG
jgi:hypothetical protein